jgi:pyrroline-5-carboxylate reductase
MQNIAIDMGISPEVAKDFAIQTAYGAAKLALETQEDLAKLRDKVTSKGGTTEAALQVMQEKGLNLILDEAMEACRKKASKLSQQFS